MLYLIGLGLSDEQDLSLKGLKAAKSCDIIFLETYTCPFLGSVKKLEKLVGKKIKVADRKLVEINSDEILKPAKNQNVALLIVGDVFSATTHIDLLLRAKEQNVKTEIIHNASVLTAIAETGLSLYKFGKIASIPFLVKGWQVDSPYDLLKENRDAHTLFLLDLRPDEKVFMNASQAIEFLLDVEKRRNEKVFSEDTECVIAAALGTKKQLIIYGKAKDVMKKKIKSFPEVLIVPGKLHFVEQEALNLYKV